MSILMSKKRDKSTKDGKNETTRTRNTTKARMSTARNGNAIHDATKNMGQEEWV